MLTLVFNEESHSGTSTLNIEESRGDSSEPFTENSATFFCYTLCVCAIALVCKFSFNSVLVLHLINLSPIHPPLGDLQLVSKRGALNLGLTTLG